MIEKLPEELRPERYSSLNDVLEYIFEEHRERPAFSCFGTNLSYGEMDELSNKFAAYLINETALEVGDRIAIQLPNVLQFPIALYGALKAGLVVVNTNPLYTAVEMAHQFSDSGVKAIVILENFCDKLQDILHATAIETIIVSSLGDAQPMVKGALINTMARYVRKMVPPYELAGIIPFKSMLEYAGEYVKPTGLLGEDNVAVILYTGGTTGFAKGAMLSHRNLVTNMMQLRSRCLLIIEDRVETIAAPLPLYHSYAFLLHCLTMPYAGNLNLLVPNPRDINGVIKLLRSNEISGMVGINTLYLAMMRHPDFSRIDFSTWKFCGAGGMAMSSSVMEQWEQATGCEIFEGYGLTECSPVVSVNLPGQVRPGTVGQVVPETEIKTVDEEGNEVPEGEPGELWVRGPQVMIGYWQQEQATAETITSDGWLKTGDYATIGDEGFITIVDRKKDMILVSGFNVYPNEIEDWVNRHPGIVESAAVGIPNEATGESVRLFVVKASDEIDEKTVLEHCKEGLTAYKQPREICFVDDLPKSIIGKVLRKELRD